MTENEKLKDENREEPPPLLKNWKQVYLAVAFNLVFLIILFYIFTEYFK